MARVIGVDPGTVSLDLCGLDDGRVFLDRSLVTADALADPSIVIVRLACLAAAGEPGGIGGLGSLMRALARSTLPVAFTPGVVYLASVPAHRKVSRVDMGGAFSAAVAVEQGRIVDGIGGSSGPLGLRGAGALDGEVAFLAGTVANDLLFRGGVATIAGSPDAPQMLQETLVSASTPQGRLAWAAYVESAVKAVAALAVSGPRACEAIISGRMAWVAGVREELARRLSARRRLGIE